MVLPGTLSIVDAGRELATHGTSIGDGIWVSDAAGQPVGYLTFQRFAALLGGSLAIEEETPDNEAVHAIHH
jgi:hypothetical protein